MSWRALTEDDVYDALDDARATVLRAALLRPGQEDPLPVAIRKAVAYARDSIRSNVDNVLDPEPTHVPEGCIDSVTDLVIYRLGRRLSRALKITDEDKEAWKQALAYFKEVAKGSMAVEQFNAGADAPAKTAAPRIVSRGRSFTRDTQEGI